MTGREVTAKEEAKRFISAAPVGVQSSPSLPSEKVGTPFKSSAVAGEGTGITPCAHLTEPKPVLTAVETILSGESSLIAAQKAVTSAIAS